MGQVGAAILHEPFQGPFHPEDFTACLHSESGTTGGCALVGDRKVVFIFGCSKPRPQVKLIFQK